MRRFGWLTGITQLNTGPRWPRSLLQSVQSRSHMWWQNVWMSSVCILVQIMQ